MNARALRAGLVALVGTLLALVSPTACAPDADPPPAAVVPPTQPASSPARMREPFAVGAIAAARFGFRLDGDAWVGGPRAYAVRATGAGLSVTPTHHPSPQLAPVRGAPLTLGAPQITRGSTRLDAPGGVPTLHGDGSLQIARGPLVVEHLRNDANAAEQSWTFDGRPPGEGDLVVKLAVSGQRFVTANANGLHFVDAATGVGVRYGHATWIDALGVKTPVPVRFVAGAIDIAVPASVVDGSAFPAVLDPTVFPEFGIDNPVVGPSTGVKDATSEVACAATSCLVVWEESRPGDSFLDIYGARVSTTGEVLDPGGIRISTASWDQSQPAVAFDGSQYLVVWQDQRAGVVSSAKLHIYGARVNLAGTVLDPDGFAITSGTFNETRPAVGFNGTTFLVAWNDVRDPTTGGDVYGARVASDASVLDPVGFPIAKSARAQFDPTIACDPASCLVVWTHNTAPGSGTIDLYGGRVTPSGGLLDGLAGFAVSTAPDDQFDARIAFDGTSYLVVWTDRRNVASLVTIDVYGARVTSAGVVLDPLGIPIAASPGAHEQLPGVASDGTNWLVVWSESGGMARGARVASSGAVLDAPSFVLTSPPVEGSRPAVAFDGTKYLVSFTSSAENSATEHHGSVWGARVSTAGAVLDTPPIVVGATASRQEMPAVAFDGTNFLVVWSDFRRDEWDLLCARVNNDGVVLDPAGIVLSSAPGNQKNAKVAFDGTNYLVVWDDYRDGTTPKTYGARVSKSGAVLDPAGIAIGPSALRGFACATGTCLVTWHQAGTSAVDSDVFGARVNGSGVVLDPTGIPIATGRTGQYNPRVGFDGTNFAVIWQDAMSGGRIWGGRVTTAGALLDPGGLDLGIAVDLDAIAYDGTNYLLVWAGSYLGNDEILALRFTPSLALVGAGVIQISSESGSEETPAVAFDGVNYLVAYAREGHPVSAGVLARRVSPAGTKPDTAPDAVSNVPRSWQPAVASNGRQRSLVVYSKWVGGPGLNAYRIRARIVDATFGLACTTDSQCGTGHCVDEVCCDTACGGGSKSDCMACSTTWGAVSNGTCGPMLAGLTCRAAAGVCDVAEKCDGTSLECPADGFAASSKICRPSSGPCDAAETCSGGSASCPEDAKEPAGTVCRASAGPCDPEEKCDGASSLCPLDALEPATKVCRPAAGDCDVAETCSGVSAACPPDGFAASTTLCRASAGLCDVAEHCSGAAASCPPDAVVSAGTQCRAKSGACDLAESCDGASVHCPGDTFVTDGTSCADSLACNGAEVCMGGACTAGVAPDCDDLDPCTVDSCAEPGGCTHAPIPGCADAGSDAGPDVGADAAPEAGSDADAAPDDATGDTAGDTAVLDSDEGDAAIDAGADVEPLPDAPDATDAETAPDSPVADADAGTDAADDSAIDSSSPDTADTMVDDTAADTTPTPDTSGLTDSSTPADTAAAEDTSDDGALAPAAAPSDEAASGCGCRTVASTRNATAWWLVVLPLLLVRRSRRWTRGGGHERRARHVGS